MTTMLCCVPVFVGLLLATERVGGNDTNLPLPHEPRELRVQILRVDCGGLHSGYSMVMCCKPTAGEKVVTRNRPSGIHSNIQWGANCVKSLLYRVWWFHLWRYGPLGEVYLQSVTSLLLLTGV